MLGPWRGQRISPSERPPRQSRSACLQRSVPRSEGRFGLSDMPCCLRWALLSTMPSTDANVDLNRSCRKGPTLSLDPDRATKVRERPERGSMRVKLKNWRRLKPSPAYSISRLHENVAKSNTPRVLKSLFDAMQ